MKNAEPSHHISYTRSSCAQPFSETVRGFLGNWRTSSHTRPGNGSIGSPAPESRARSCGSSRLSLREIRSRRSCKGRSRSSSALLLELLHPDRRSYMVIHMPVSTKSIAAHGLIPPFFILEFQQDLLSYPRSYRRKVLFEICQQSVLSSGPGYHSHLLRSCLSFALVPVAGAVVK